MPSPPSPSTASRTHPLTSHDQLSLFAQTWTPTPPSHRHVVIVHGVGEHSDRYSHTVAALTAARYHVHSWDQRGHGRSGGLPGHVPAWRDYRRDLQTLLATLPSNEPVFLLGHSMGSLVVLDTLIYGEAHPTGVIISGVPVQPAGVAKPHLVLISRLLSRLWPTFPFRLPLHPEDLTTEAQSHSELRRDPMARHRVTVRWGSEALQAVSRLRLQAQKITSPLLVLHGGQDPVNLPDGGRWLYENVRSTDKTLRIYPDSRHEPHNDIERDQVLADLIAWLDQHAEISVPSLT
ncbi:MAG: lysophospholipase [Verrucomicrobiales bacterium]|nr:lysophospholipase [Verrucomicrobiales bacterium]